MCSELPLNTDQRFSAGLPLLVLALAFLFATAGRWSFRDQREPPRRDPRADV